MPPGLPSPDVSTGVKTLLLVAGAVPPPLLPVTNRRYTSGEFDLFDGRSLYVNRGLGYLRRVRFNARPEITQFTLRKAVSVA